MNSMKFLVPFLLPLLVGLNPPDVSVPAPAKSADVNADGSIDKGLPSTAAPGAKVPKDGDDILVMTTDMGRIVLKLFPEVAPKHVKNILDLTKKQFYDGSKFHRVIPGFMIQGGDPNTIDGPVDTWGQGGPGYTVDAEFNDTKHKVGILSMARSDDPNSAGSQFFIVQKDSFFLDKHYTAFGQVIEGMDVVDKIANVERTSTDRPIKNVILKKVEAVKWPFKLEGPRK
jgi:peptidyl-prolyl cis-trans isomerase B (cyclophilin B)